MKYETSHENPFDMAAFIDSMSKSSMTLIKSKNKERLSRFYDLIVTDLQNNIVIEAKNINEHRAGRLRNKYRQKHGHRVSLFETGTSGEIHRIPDNIEIIEHHSALSDAEKPPVIKKGLKQREINYLRKMRQNILRKENAALERATRDDKIRVYDKLSNELWFSGNLPDAVNYILAMQEAKKWNENSWVIYLPKKWYDKVVD